MRYLIQILALTLALTLTACGSDHESQITPPSVTTEPWTSIGKDGFEYSYDAEGNLLSVDRHPDKPTEPNGGFSVIKGGFTWHYDANGNLLSRTQD